MLPTWASQAIGTFGNIAFPFIALPALLTGCSSDEAILTTKSGALTGCPRCTVLRGGTVFDGTRAGRGAVVLEGARIREVIFDEVERAFDGEVIDVTGKTVLPGLIDLHVHSLSTAGPWGHFDGDLRAEDHLKAMLRSGVTSYLDLGSPRHVIFEYRARIDAGAMLAPRLFASGPFLTATGGHPCYRGSPPGDVCVFIDSPADVEAAFHELVPDGPDILKVVVDAGWETPLPRMSRAAIETIEDAAESAGLHVIAHVSTLEDVEDALAAGVTRFAHLPMTQRIPPELARRMAAAQAVVVPTAAVNDALYRVAHSTLTELDDPTLDDDVPSGVIAALRDPSRLSDMTSEREQALTAAWRENVLASLAACREAGVTIAAGTDAGNPGNFHGLAMARELALYVEAGMRPLDALTASTRTAALLLGRPELGRLAPGAIADVLVVDGDALADIHALSRVARVYKDGVLLDRAALALTRATSLARAETSGIGDGDTCLDASECRDGLQCTFDQVCAPACGGSGECAPGSACVWPDDAGAAGFCLASDGCDVLQQDCPNDAACVFLGQGATACWVAGAGKDGDPCSGPGACAAGSVCDAPSGTCKDLCDPSGASRRGCPAGKQCVDHSRIAGVLVGACE